jgi:hypothetical protein
MWRVVATLVALGLSWPAMAQGFYGISSHYQTNPNSTMSDNYGTMGNFNPYTGSYGTRPEQ